MGRVALLFSEKNASTLLNLVNDSDEDELSILTDKLAKTITSEVRDISVDKSRSNARITKEDISKSVSSTLMDVLGKLSANMDYTLPALLIGNIVTSIISNNPTNLQIALGNLIRDSKSLINQMYQFGVTCSYNEILRFKKSAALAATNDIQLSGIHEGDGGLIQTLVDNFDADISQNGKLTMHSLAMLITQPCTQPDESSAVLWVVHWPAKGVVADYVENFKKFLERKLQDSGVYLVFDRYREYSTKSITRQVRECEASRPYQLTESMPLPSQKAVLTVTANKQQLISIICTNISNDEKFHLSHTSRNKLVITGSSNTPTEIYKGVVIQGRDISTSHEEVDNIIAQQAVICAKHHSGTIVVVTDDTDVFILLLYHYPQENLTCPLFMTSPIQQ